MKQKSWASRLFPHALAVAVFALLTVIIFLPMFQDNKVLQQGDIVQYKGVSHEIVNYREQTGNEPLWTNSMFSGMPAFQISTTYKGNLLRFIDTILTLGLPYPSSLMFMLLLGFYILLITLDVEVWLSIAGAIAFGFSSFNFVIIAAGHNSEAHVLSLLPISLAGILMIFRRQYVTGGVLTAAALSLVVMNNHLQIAYYLFLLTLVFLVVEFIFAAREKTLKPFFTSVSVLAIAGIFAVLTNLSLLWTSYDYGNETIRGKSELTSNKKSSGGLDEDYAFQWSYGKMETLTLLVPGIFGGSSNSEVSENSNMGDALRGMGIGDQQVSQIVQDVQTYWGDQPFTSGPVYLGAIICFLFVLGCFIIKGPIKWWLLSVSALAILYSWGHNFLFFNDILFKYFPGLNKFRTVTMILIIPQFAFPLLGILALKKILSNEVDKKELLKYLKWSLYAVGGLVLVIMLLGPSLAGLKGVGDDEFKSQWLQRLGGHQDALDKIYDALLKDRASIMRMDAFRSLIFILLAAGAIFYYSRGKLNKNLVYGAFILLVFIDMFTVGKRYLNDRNFVDDSEYSKIFQPSQADQSILGDRALDFRVLNLTVSPFQDGSTSYLHKSIGGYSAAKLRRYQELIDQHLQPEISSMITVLRSNKMDSVLNVFNNMGVLNMLNDKYVIINPNGAPLSNNKASGNCWFVNSYKIVANADSEIAALNGFDPKRVCFIDKRFSEQLSGHTISADSSASIKLQSYEPNDLMYQSSNKNEGLAVFSEVYYDKGWNAYVDGKQSPYFRCDYVLRGMILPSGDHKVEFKFEPKDYYTGETVSLYSSILLILIAAGGIVIYRRQLSK